MTEPDWGDVFCLIAERFPGYTFDKIADLTWLQVKAMFRYIEKHPAPYVIPIDPS